MKTNGFFHSFSVNSFSFGSDLIFGLVKRFCLILIIRWYIDRAKAPSELVKYTHIFGSPKSELLTSYLFLKITSKKELSFKFMIYIILDSLLTVYVVPSD
ncbi:hypothetical protein BpHYR1_035573 [Brachionus plicatilis]|uniref:Uncharacterized protein n=1 Tax=Brachionus plicatilis TaxID=10195 RepID=A0A3M7PDM9_BRAPC|nr:hypothetical protein BpHYR1_035573 [Brachionus plicatilis]